MAGLAMGTTKAKPKVAHVTHPSQKRPQLKALGGSQSDAWNDILANQTMQSLWQCYRRAMLAEQTFEGRRENLSQANKLSRSCAVLLEALNRHRGKGQQKVTVEHVTVNAGGQAIVGSVQAPGGGAPSQT